MHTKIAFPRHGGLKTHDRENWSILPLRIFRKVNKASIPQGEIACATQRHMPRRPQKFGVPSSQSATSDAQEKSDVEAFRSDLELMLASMSAALSPNQWRSDGIDSHISDPDSTLESDVADAVRQLSIRALGV
ncbi:hypothetical protein [Hyphomicrobium sp. MC8b]|uniref:hypothetical protein n=1 Tax=Hyphomicrobium sp. MC8b TaxID=300273 RepID=UPI00391890F8